MSKTEVLPLHEYQSSMWKEPRNVIDKPPFLLALDDLELTQFCKLASCIRANDKPAISLLLKYGVNNLINYVHPYDEIGTALGIAADMNDESMVTFLLANGANPNVVDLKGRTAATRACDFGHVESLKVLVEAGCDVNIRDEDGNGILFYCIGSSKRHALCAELALDNGADVNVINKQGKPVFVAHCDNASNNEEVCILMVANNVDPNLQDLNTRRTAIMAAAASGSFKVVKAILEKGINNINETMDKTKVHAVHEAAKSGNLEILKILSAYGADFDQQTSSAYCHSLTPMHMSADIDKGQCCLFAGQRGANALLKNRAGLTPNQLAKRKGFKATAKACRQAQKYAPKKKKKKKKSKNPEVWIVKLHDFIYFRENQMLEEFEKYDTNMNNTVHISQFWQVVEQFKLPVPPDKTNQFNEIVGKHMKDEDHVNYLKFILGNIYIPKKMLMSKFQKKIKKMKALKKMKKKPNIPICKAPEWHRPLEYIKAHQDIYDPLRFDRDRVPKSEFVNDAIWYMSTSEPRMVEKMDAIRQKDEPTVYDALESGTMMLNDRSRFYKTPLMAAIMNNDVELVKDFIARGANVNARDNFLWTPLHMACHMASLEMVQLLLQGGAKPKIVSFNKATPLMRAIESNALAVVKSLAYRKDAASEPDPQTLQALANAFADYFVFQLLPKVDEKDKKKKDKKANRKNKKQAKISIPSMGIIEPKKSINPRQSATQCSFPPIFHHSRMINTSHPTTVEKLYFQPANLWTKKKNTEELLAERKERRLRLGWKVDFDDYLIPFLQNVQDKLDEIERELNEKIERPILKRKAAK